MGERAGKGKRAGRATPDTFRLERDGRCFRWPDMTRTLCLAALAVALSGCRFTNAAPDDAALAQNAAGPAEGGASPAPPPRTPESAAREPTPDPAPERATEAPAPNTAAPDAGATEAIVVPARFRGRFAPDRKACGRDYTYSPAFQTVTVRRDGVNFFETGGPVTNVAVDGDSAAITVRERVGDRYAVRAIYLALEGDGAVRYRPGLSEPSRRFVRCPAE